MKKLNSHIDVNFAFVRHGYGCHNIVSSMYSYGHVNEKLFNEITRNNTNNIYKDPVLTETGVFTSIHNGIVIKDTISKNSILPIKHFNIIGCSPLIRSMETAYFMTSRWKNPPKKIYVFPLLREIDEHSKNKYSEKSKKIINTRNSYAMKSIKEQKQYLQSIGILDFFDFSYVEKFQELRNEPGDIKNFIRWFAKYVLLNMKNSNKTQDNIPQLLNIFIVTHAGVLKDYAKEGFPNNSGFLLQSKVIFKPWNYYKISKAISLRPLTNPELFLNVRNTKEMNDYDYNCPSNRCSYFCKNNNDIKKPRKLLKSNLITNQLTENSVNLTTPQITEPLINLMTPQITKPQLNITTPQMTKPQLNITTPQMTKPRLNITTPQMTKPRLNAMTPQITKPRLNITTPQITKPRLNITTPQITKPRLNITTPQTTERKLNVMIPQTTEPQVNTMIPQITEPQLNAMTFQITEPQVNTMIPQITEPQLNAMTPQITEPQVNTMIPQITETPVKYSNKNNIKHSELINKHIEVMNKHINTMKDYQKSRYQVPKVTQYVNPPDA